MIDFEKYNLNEEDVKFFFEIEDYCINGQSEVVLKYKGKSFVLEPSGEEVSVYAYDKNLGQYKNFDELFLNHKIDGKPLIEIIKDLDFGD